MWLLRITVYSITQNLDTCSSRSPRAASARTSGYLHASPLPATAFCCFLGVYSFFYFLFNYFLFFNTPFRLLLPGASFYFAISSSCAFLHFCVSLDAPSLFPDSPFPPALFPLSCFFKKTRSTFCTLLSRWFSHSSISRKPSLAAPPDFPKHPNSSLPIILQLGLPSLRPHFASHASPSPSLTPTLTTPTPSSFTSSSTLSRFLPIPPVSPPYSCCASCLCRKSSPSIPPKENNQFVIVSHYFEALVVAALYDWISDRYACKTKRISAQQ